MSHGQSIRILAVLLHLHAAAGWLCSPSPTRPFGLGRLASPRTSAPAIALEEDSDESGADLFVTVDDISDDDVEDLFFLFDARGAAKPWAVPPHLQALIDAVALGRAKLLDVRPVEAWRLSSISLATHCALDQLPQRLRGDGLGEGELALLGWARETTVYVFSGFGSESEVATAVELLRGAGFEGAVGLRDSFEALRASLPRSRRG